jgi:DNA-binding MarR family transcriptional regulator
MTASDREHPMCIEPSAEDSELARLRLILERVGGQQRYALTLKQLTTLLACYETDQDRTLRMIATRIGSAKPAVSRMLEHLIDLGLIERLADPRDRRSALFQHTPAAQKFLRGIVAEAPAERHGNVN